MRGVTLQALRGVGTLGSTSDIRTCRWPSVATGMPLVQSRGPCAVGAPAYNA